MTADEYEAVPISEIQQMRDRVALLQSVVRGAADELEARGPRACARKSDQGGWRITVVTTGSVPCDEFTVEARGDAAFAPAASGHRLIERGWEPLSCAIYAPDRTAGWRLCDDGTWTAPVAPS